MPFRSSMTLSSLNSGPPLKSRSWDELPEVKIMFAQPVEQLEIPDVNLSFSSEPSPGVSFNEIKDASAPVQIRYAGTNAVEFASDTIREKVGRALYNKIAEIHNPEFAARVTGMILEDFYVEDFVQLMGNKVYLLGGRVRLRQRPGYHPHRC